MNIFSTYVNNIFREIERFFFYGLSQYILLSNNERGTLFNARVAWVKTYFEKLSQVWYEFSIYLRWVFAYYTLLLLDFIVKN